MVIKKRKKGKNHKHPIKKIQRKVDALRDAGNNNGKIQKEVGISGYILERYYTNKINPTGGRPKKVINYELLKKLCAIHCTGQECAGMIEVSMETLERRLREDGHGSFKQFFLIHSAKTKARLRQTQIKQALMGNPQMLTWLGKNLLNQADKTETLVGELPPEKSMTDDELREKLESEGIDPDVILK